MDFMFNGKRHLVSWQHYSDDDLQWGGKRDGGEPVAHVIEGLALAILAESGILSKDWPDGFPRRTHLFDGLTICRIRTLKDNHESLPASQRWETVAEGYAFKRWDEKRFDKRLARKISLTKALAVFDKNTRKIVWMRYHRIWPLTASNCPACSVIQERSTADQPADL